MGDTIATLGIKVTSTGVKETSENLEKVSKSSEKAQKSIDKLLESYKQQEIRAKSGKAGLAEYKLSLLGATEAEKKFAAETIKATQAIQNNAKTLDQSIKALLSLAQAGSAIFIFQRVGGALKSFFNDVLEVTKSTQSMQIALNAATGSANLGKEAFSFLRIESERLGLVLNDQVKGFSRIAAAAKGTALEGQGIKDVYSSISEASTVLQLSTDDTMGVLKALTDIISKGTVQAEELRGQLGDRLPGAFQIAADAMEMTTEELNKQLKAGKVLSEDFLPKFAKKIKEQFAGSVEEASKSIQANLNRTENAWEQLKRTMYSAFNEDLNNLIIDTTKYIKNLTDRLGDPDVQKDIKDITDALRLMADVGIDIGNLAIYLSKVLKPLKELNDAVADGLNPWKAYTFFLKKIVKDDSDLLKEENKNTKDFLKDMSSQWSEWEKETNDIIKRREAKKPKGIERDEKEVKKLLESLQEENDQLTLSSDALIRKKAALAGATKEEIELLSALTAKNNAIKEGTKASKEAEDQENKRVKFIEDYIAKLEQEADTYKKGKEYTADYVLGLKDATEAQKQRAKVVGAFIDAAKRQDSAEKKNKKNLEDYATLMKKVMPDFEKNELSRQQALDLTATIFKDKLTPAMMGTSAALHLFDEQSESIKNINEYFDTKEIDDFTQKTDELKDKLKFEGTSFGNEIADGINNAVISMQKFNEQLDKQTKYQKDIDKLQKEIDTTSNLDLKAKKQKEMDDLAQEGIKGQLSAYRQLFGTTSQLFKENSKERKALHNLEMAFAMAEIAMNLQKTISAAYTAIMTQGAGDPYSAFGRIAAMTALAGGIVAAAGGSLSGGGSGSAPTAVSSASQSTALGSTEQSQSIANAFSFLEDIESGQYNELKDISSSMKDLNKNITGLVTSIVRTGGINEFDGVAGKTSTTGSNILKYGAGTPFLSPIAVNDLIQGVKSGISKPIKDALTAISPFTLGASGLISDLLSSATSAVFGGSKKTSILSSGLQITPGTIESGQYSTQAYADIKVKKEGGLFGSDKTYFKTLTDDVDQSVQDMVSLVFKNMGETMVDIAKGLGTDNLEEVFNYVFDIGKIDLKGLDTEGINKALQEAFSTASDKAATDLFGELIGRYQKIGEGILETAVRLVGEKAVIMDVLELTNQGFDGSDIPAKALEVTQALIDMAGGLDNLTDAASVYYDKFFDDGEKQIRLQGQLVESFESLNLKLPSTRAGYRAIIESLDLTTESGQRTYVTLLGLSEGADKYYTTLEEGSKKTADSIKAEEDLAKAREEAIKKTERSLTVELLTAQGKSVEALALSRQIEIESIDESLRTMKLRIWQLQDEAAASEKAAKEAEEAQKAIEEAAKARKSELETLIRNTVQAQIDGYQAIADAANEALSKAEGLLTRSFEAEKKRITTIHEGIIEGLTKNLDDAQVSADELRSAFEGLGSARKAMALAGTEQSSYNTAQSQLFSALGLARTGDFSGAKAVAADTSALTQDTKGFYSSFEDYQREFFKTKNAITELEGLTGDALSVQETMVAILNQQIVLENTHFETQILKLDEQLDGILGVDKSVITLTEAITQYQEAQYAADGANTLLKKQTEQLEGILNTLFNTQANTGNLVLLVDEYLNPEKYKSPEEIKQESESAAITAETNAALLDEIKKLREEMTAANYSNAKSNLKTATVLNKWDKDGMPATTV